MPHQRRHSPTLLVVVVVGALLLAACETAESSDGSAPAPAPASGAPTSPGVAEPRTRAKPTTVTLAFAGDVHFEGALVDLPGRADSTLGPMSRTLREADVAMVNLESALTSGGAPASKELEDASNRYWFRSPPEALDLLDRSGVDVVSLANNHGADYGAAGLRDTLRIAVQSPVGVLGVGRTQRQAYRPHRVSVRGTDVAIFAADASMRESADPTWDVRPGTGIGLATARVPHVRPLVEAVRAAGDDLVVVYLHWGQEGDTCPTGSQQRLARSLTDAGADIVVGTHAHELIGAGTLDTTYVSYGLGNFFWYHGQRSETGVLRLRVRADEVVSEEWMPGRIPTGGGAPQPLAGAERRAAVDSWSRLRGCTDLAPGPGPAAAPPATGEPAPPPVPRTEDDLPPFTAAVRRISPALGARMRTTSYDPATCPVPLDALRHLSLTHVDFEGRVHQGSMVVNAEVADDVVGVFEALYRARFPIQRMRLVDAYGGDDNRSMAANNTSGFNCRTVAGSSTFSDHAYGRAVDINPVQNPYVVGGEVLPPAGQRFVSVDRTPGPPAARPGVISQGDVVTRAFDRIGWSWGAEFSEPDYQHFAG